MKVFLSHAVSPQDAPIAARLRAVAAAYDIQILLPDRTHYGGPSAATLRQISQSDAVVALITGQTQVDHVNQELKFAAEAKKPIIVLVAPPGQVQGVDENQIVRFDRWNPYAHEQQLMSVLENIRRQQNQSKLWNTLGWIAGIALALAALSALTADEK